MTLAKMKGEVPDCAGEEIPDEPAADEAATEAAAADPAPEAEEPAAEDVNEMGRRLWRILYERTDI